MGRELRMENGRVEDARDGGKRCPECGSDVKNTIAYTHGHRTSDGWECTECDWWCLFGDEPWPTED